MVNNIKSTNKQFVMLKKYSSGITLNINNFDNIVYKELTKRCQNSVVSAIPYESIRACVSDQKTYHLDIAYHSLSSYDSNTQKEEPYGFLSVSFYLASPSSFAAVYSWFFILMMFNDLETIFNKLHITDIAFVKTNDHESRFNYYAISEHLYIKIPSAKMNNRLYRAIVNELMCLISNVADEWSISYLQDSHLYLKIINSRKHGDQSYEIKQINKFKEIGMTDDIDIINSTDKFPCENLSDFMLYLLKMCFHISNKSQCLKEITKDLESLQFN